MERHTCIFLENQTCLPEEYHFRSATARARVWKRSRGEATARHRIQRSRHYASVKLFLHLHCRFLVSMRLLSICDPEMNDSYRCFLLIRYKFSLRSFAGLPYTVSGILHGNPGTGRGTYFARRTPRYLDSGGIYVDEDEELSDSYEFTIGAAASDQELEGMPLSPKSRNAFRTAKGLARPALYGSLASPGAKL